MVSAKPIFLLCLLFSSSWLWSCERSERKDQNEGPTKSTMRDTLAADVRVQVRAGADTTFKNNELMSGLMPRLSVDEVLRRLPEAEITRKEPFPNRHVQGQIDTLVTIKSDSAVFQFYSLPNEDLLKSATLQKSGVALGSGLEVGMTTDQVVQRIPQLQNSQSIPQTIIIQAEQTPTKLRLRFEHNKLEFMDYEGYVD